MDNLTIRQITDHADLPDCARVIRESFATLAQDLGITRENCPTHPSFIEADELRRMQRDGSVLIGLFMGGAQAGFVAVTHRGNGVFNLEKLAVLPEFRHRGFGKRLIDYVFGYAKSNAGRLVSMATVEENAVLKNWYLDYGFTITEVRRFDHLPFAVCFMEKAVE